MGPDGDDVTTAQPTPPTPPRAQPPLVERLRHHAQDLSGPGGLTVRPELAGDITEAAEQLDRLLHLERALLDAARLLGNPFVTLS